MTAAAYDNFRKNQVMELALADETGEYHAKASVAEQQSGRKTLASHKDDKTYSESTAVFEVSTNASSSEYGS